MLASAPQLHNRIAGHFAPAPIPVPATPDGKQAAWGDALFAAAMFFQARLAHPDPVVAERAALVLIDLEKTRLRHGRDLAGTTVPKPKKAELPPLPDLPPLEETMRSPSRPSPAKAKPASDKALADRIARGKECRPMHDDMTAELVGKGVEKKQARDFSFALLKLQVLDILRERHATKARKTETMTDFESADGEPPSGERHDVSPPVVEKVDHRRTDVAPFA